MGRYKIKKAKDWKAKLRPYGYREMFERARVWVNALIDDGVDLPGKIPAGKMREGIVRVTSRPQEKLIRAAQGDSECCYIEGALLRHAVQ